MKFLAIAILGIFSLSAYAEEEPLDKPTEKQILNEIQEKAVNRLQPVLGLRECKLAKKKISGGRFYHITKEIDGKSVPANHTHHSFEVTYACAFGDRYQKGKIRELKLAGTTGTKTDHDWFELKFTEMKFKRDKNCSYTNANSIYDEGSAVCSPAKKTGGSVDAETDGGVSGE